MQFFNTARNRGAVAAIALAVALAPVVATAACDEAERLRLSDEAKKLAQRNAWSGVERAYSNLNATDCVLTLDDHLNGAQAARSLGKVFEVYQRLGRARELDQRSDLVEEMESINQIYGRVEIIGDPRFRPALIRETMPFAPDQRKAIEYAIEVVANTGSFKGMLPRGEYDVSGKAFVVEAGEEFQVVEVGKIKGRDADQPLIRYANVVATLGPAFMFTPEPTQPTLDSNNNHQFAPATVFGGGAQAQVGAELGLSYREPPFAVAATVGYGGSYGADTLHQVSGWLAGVLRPDEWRFALGPTYSVTLGSGTGVAGWFDRGQDPSRQTDTITFAGVAYGGGLQASAGYGVLDLDKLRGIVELGTGWSTDGARSYVGFGVRVGIVPTVPRFKG
ncbi:MAG: hypothetical protein ACI8PZ_005249 [Myxococcota bacterium]|jgi:hypothetical protein